MAPTRSLTALLMAAVLSTATGCAMDVAASATVPTGDGPAPTAAASAAPAGRLSLGPTQPFGNGTLRTYVLSDPAGRPVEVGVRMTRAALDGQSMDMKAGMRPFVLTFPAAAGVIDHAEIYWQPHGHEPVQLFGKPHFDFHFYLLDPAAVRAISPADPKFAAHADHLPAPGYMPRDYVLPPGGASPNAVPGMGVHWLDSTTPFVPGKYDFTRVLINGSWDGQFTFIEPMLTRAWLLEKHNVSEQLKQPEAYQHTGRYPTTYSVAYDPSSDEYSIALGGMTWRQAS